MIKACVIGWPINHSRSPLIHGYWLRLHGIDGSYTRKPVEPAQLQDFIRSLPTQGLAGCNVTIPHKEAVHALVKPADATTEQLGAVNTVFLRDSEVMGTNTDGEGYINNLRQAVPGFTMKDQRAMVLGAGGASLAVVNVLLEQGAAEVVVANRSVERADDLRRRFGTQVIPLHWEHIETHLPETALLVNTTSLGMTGQADLVLDLSRLPVDAVVSDIVYTPLRTRFLETAARRGNPVVEGLGMLLHQAVRGFSLWFGVVPQVTPELHDLVARDIDPGYQR